MGVQYYTLGLYGGLWELVCVWGGGVPFKLYIMNASTVVHTHLSISPTSSGEDINGAVFYLSPLTLPPNTQHGMAHLILTILHHPCRPAPLRPPPPAPPTP